MNHHRRHGSILGFFVTLMALGLAACGHPAGGEQSVATPGVTVELGATSVSTSDTLHLTVRNSLSESIIATDHQTGCTVVQLQRQVSGAWQNEGGCAMGIATRQVPVVAGSALPVQIAPGAGQIRATPWPAGTYRVAFTYTLGASASGGTSLTVYSPTFTIG